MPTSPLSASDAGNEPIGMRHTSRYRRATTPHRHDDDQETENMNPEDLYNSIRKTTADIQNLSKLEDYDMGSGRGERDCMSQDSGEYNLQKISTMRAVDFVTGK